MTAFAEQVHRNALAPRMAGVVVLGAIFFNALLAVLNANVVPLGPTLVAVCDALVVAAAAIVALLHFRMQMLPWFLLLVPIVLFSLLRGYAVDEFEIRFIRDVALIPTFVVLGMTYPREKLSQLVIAVHLIVVAVALFEWLALDLYSRIFQIKDYYIRTRGLSEGDFWNTSSNLFVSASRPDDRFFAFVSWHRMSSIFLEPVSLGNYCIFIAAFVLATWRRLRVTQFAVLVLGVGFLLIACDGRLAALTILIMVALSLFAGIFPARMTLLFPPIVLIAAFALVTVLSLKSGSDNFSGRIAHTVDLLSRFTISDYFGMSNLHLSGAVDSGIAYLIVTQSLFCTLAIWFGIGLLTEEQRRDAIAYKTAVTTYLSLSLLVSFSFLSIKTAAPLWFVMGALQPLRLDRHRCYGLPKSPSLSEAVRC